MQEKHPNIQFKASDGWLRNFNNRNGFTLRRVTTTGKEMPENTLEIIKKHLNECEQLLTGIDRNQIINMDETAIYLDSASNYSYAVRGSKRIKATTTGNERTKLSAAFTAAASGRKLPIFMIIPRKTDLPDFEPPDNCTSYKLISE